MPLLRERLQQGTSRFLLSRVREYTYSPEQGITHTVFCPYGSSVEDESMYAGSRKTGTTERGRSILVEGSEKMQLLNLEGFFLFWFGFFYFFYSFNFTGRNLRCRMQDVGDLDFCSSEEIYFLSAAMVPNYLDISIR